MGNISIDGFKRERYVVKIRDNTDELARAYRAIREEEGKIETTYVRDRMEASVHKTQGYSLNESHRESYSTEREFKHHQEVETTEAYIMSIQLITDLLLKIETLEENNKQLLAKLQLKEKKWIENDRVFKERRFYLMAVLQYDLALAIDCIRHQAYLNSLADNRVSQHEKYALLTYQVFEVNRNHSELFLSQASYLV